ncbi:MAG: hypothetical protein M1819_002546 [Sarea resinae]|nr:MAG: hypothetical protein M1819_002546 [Sarea resinae]
MASSVDAKLLKQTKFPPEFNQKVDMQKVNIEVMKKWIAGKISEILGNEDDVVIELCFNLLEGARFPNIKVLQIQLTGFLDKDTAKFCKELWNLCLSAQSNPQGVPKELLEAKKLELIQEKIEAEKAAEETIFGSVNAANVVEVEVEVVAVDEISIVVLVAILDLHLLDAAARSLGTATEGLLQGGRWIRTYPLVAEEDVGKMIGIAVHRYQNLCHALGRVLLHPHDEGTTTSQDLGGADTPPADLVRLLEKQHAPLAEGGLRTVKTSEQDPLVLATLYHPYRRDTPEGDPHPALPAALPRPRRLGHTVADIPLYQRDRILVL